MKKMDTPSYLKRLIQVILVSVAFAPMIVCSQEISPSAYWKNEVEFPADRFFARGISRDSDRWVKFTLLGEPYDPNTVYFQDSRKYVYHYGFASECLDPFLGMTTAQFNAVTLFEQGQEAMLGALILPPLTGLSTTDFNEVGIQFVRQDPYTREEILAMFNVVKSAIQASVDLDIFYFPAYEQQAVAAAHSTWFESQGILLGSTARWAQGNTCYAEGWALGTLNYVPASDIETAFHNGSLRPTDILLTNGIPAELPFVAGIISLVPSTPNSHVAILARSYGVPFVHLLLPQDAERAQALVGHRIVLSAYNDPYGSCDTRLIDTENLLDDALATEILELKQPSPLAITPMTAFGAAGVSTQSLAPSDILYVGGKAANFGILHASVPMNSPQAAALSFDVWQAFLDQPLTSGPLIELGPGEHILIWADSDEEQGPLHAGFKLDRAGESVALFASDGSALIDALHYGGQTADVSYGRVTDGSEAWQFFPAATPGQSNGVDPSTAAQGLVINEIMALNRTGIEDPNEAGQFPDWIELYNASDQPVVLNGLYLTDDVNDPGKWQIPPLTEGVSLRHEISQRLGDYTYPPEDMQALVSDLALVRSLFSDAHVTRFSSAVQKGILEVLSDPNHGFNPNAMLRFRSSTNVEDSADFVGAGLYDSYSGCFADELDGENQGPCACDPNRTAERGVFRAIRRVFASFYNDNAFLERLRHRVNEAEVGMAVLVHHSFPDEIELANGVATVERSGDTGNTVLTLVSQQGAISVTNPVDASVPEEVTITVFSSGNMVPPRLKRPSSRIPLGGTVMAWRDDYVALTDLLMKISDQFSQATGKTSYVLDLEYKKVAPGGEVLPAGGLVVKQVRQVPTPDQTPRKTPFLLNAPLEFEVFPGEVEEFEETDVFANHRLKSRWTLETRNMPLDSNSLSTGLYSYLQLEYLDKEHVATLSLPMAQLPWAEHSASDTRARDTWQLADVANPRVYHLQTTDIPRLVSSAENPILTLADLGTHPYNLPYKCLTLDVEYAHPVLSWYRQIRDSDPPSGLDTTNWNKVYLWPREPEHPDDILETRSFSAGGVSIETSFYIPPIPKGLASWTQTTRPLKRWVRTLIQGLSSEPIVLKGYYSQTFKPDHHNQTEHFLFEPRLEPDISADVLAQLRDRDIRLVHLFVDNMTADPGDFPHEDQSEIMTYGFDLE
jgi:hypothetical protein